MRVESAVPSLAKALAAKLTHGFAAGAPRLAPTPRSTVASLGGTARLYHFHVPDAAPSSSGEAEPGPAVGGIARGEADAYPLLIVPSMINRWYVVDLREGASLVRGLLDGGIDTFCLDWGVVQDEDRYLTWDEVIARIGRAVRAVRRATGASRVGILGYCMGSTVAGIHTALRPERVAAFVNLAGPFDFHSAGVLGELVDQQWFDVDAIADAGNVSAHQMQAGFSALRPTLPLAKIVRTVDTSSDPKAQQAAAALEAWSSDNIPFPGEAYRTYIRELYQENRLIAGTHRVAGRVVDLGRIHCPVLSIVATRDAICPPAAATALNDHVSSAERDVLTVPGGHVGAVVGRRASSEMYPAVASWLRDKLSRRRRQLAVVGTPS